MRSKTARYCIEVPQLGLCVVVTLVMTTVVAAGDRQDGPSVTAEEPVAGVVIRLSEQLFQSPQPEVDRITGVSQTVVGVRNTGTAHTTGQIYPDFRLSRTGMAFDLTFDGVTVSRTVGRQQNARIDSTTSTRVTVQTPITFEVTRGFVAGDAVTNANVDSACRRVSSEVHGLRGLITRKVAQRRIRRLEGQIRFESARATGSRIQQENEAEVAAALKRWNAQWEPIRQVLVQQTWFGEEPAVHISSDEQHLMFYVTRQPLDPKQVRRHSLAEKVPPEHVAAPLEGALVEIIFYDDEVRLPVVATVVAIVDEQLREHLANRNIADQLAIRKTDGPDWVRLSIMKKASEKGPDRQ